MEHSVKPSTIHNVLNVYTRQNKHPIVCHWNEAATCTSHSALMEGPTYLASVGGDLTPANDWKDIHLCVPTRSAPPLLDISQQCLTQSL